MASKESTSPTQEWDPPASKQATLASTNKTIQNDDHRPSDQFTNRLLVASGTAFVAGIFGSLWYQGRKTRQRGIHRAAVAASSPGTLASSRSTSALPTHSVVDNNHNIPKPRLQSLQDVKTTEALLREGRLLGLKAFAIATALCLSGAAVIVGTTRWALDVHTIPEFSAKMRDLFPKQRAKFVGAVVDADKAVFGNEKVQESGADALLSSSLLSKGAASGSQGPETDEVDLDHEQDSNLLSRIERDLKKLAEEEDS